MSTTPTVTPVVAADPASGTGVLVAAPGESPLVVFFMPMVAPSPAPMATAISAATSPTATPRTRDDGGLGGPTGPSPGNGSPGKADQPSSGVIHSCG